MKKFLTLFKKEISELITVQTILPLIIIMVIFSLIGTVVSKEMKKTSAPKQIFIVDENKSQLSKGLIEFVDKSGFRATVIDKNVDEAISEAKNKKIQVVGVIPADFEKNVSSNKQEVITIYTIMERFSTSAARDSSNFSNLIGVINDYTSRQLIASKIKGISPDEVKNPIKSNDVVVVQNKQAITQPAAIIGFIGTQTAFIPVILFVMILMSSVMIATAMATERENKTLETLLTAPIDRKNIILAKMSAAGIYALFFAGVYMFGFRSLMNQIEGSTGASAESVKAAISQLGLTLGWPQYMLLGITLFISVLIALTIAIIIGIFAEDVKSVNGLIAPLMFLIMIPYLLTLLLDINTLTPWLRWLVYAIPFSHPFLAAPNLYLHNYSIIYYGIAYQAIIFVIFIYIAAKLFSTDKITTVKLNFNRKSLLRR